MSEVLDDLADYEPPIRYEILPGYPRHVFHFKRWPDL